MKMTFRGVRGSIPTSLPSDDVARKIHSFVDSLPDNATKDDALVALGKMLKDGYVFAFGGSTSCVQVQAGSELIILDMGSGAHALGNSLMPEILEKRGTGEVTRITICLSHMHSDHTQGLPFFAPLFLSKYDGFLNDLTFYGGTDYAVHIDEVLLSQMNPPMFPVPLAELVQRTHHVEFRTLQDGISFAAGSGMVTARKLDHPQETHGFRIEHDGRVVVYTTDHEPRHPQEPYRNLLRLVDRADVWITDCQYSDHQYRGKGKGPQRFGWGHSYPEAIAHTAAQANVKKVVLFHHDPGSSDADIRLIVAEVHRHLDGMICGHIKVVAAHEGLVLEV